MEISPRLGRVLALLLLAGMVGSALVNGVLESPLFAPSDFLVEAAPHQGQLGVAVGISLVIEGFWLAVAVLLYPILAERSRAAALWLVALGALVLAAAVIENAGVLTMVSLSRAYGGASVADRTQFVAARAAVSGARNAAHYLARVCDGAMILSLYLTLGRFSLVPRALASFGVLAALSMLASVSRPFFGYAVVFPMLAPMGLAQLALVVWLMLPRRRQLRSVGIIHSAS